MASKTSCNRDADELKETGCLHNNLSLKGARARRIAFLIPVSCQPRDILSHVVEICRKQALWQ